VVSTDVVGAAIIKDGRILLIRTKRHPRTWQFPGGIWGIGEKVEEGLARKIREEIPGTQFKIYGHVGIYWGEVYKDGVIRLIVYRVSLWTRLDASKFRLGEGIREARWVGNPGELHLAEPTAKTIRLLKKRGDL